MITIKTNGVEFAVENEDEFNVVMRLMQPNAIKATKEPIAEIPVETETVTEIKEEPFKVVHNFHSVNKESRYYHNNNGKRRFQTVGMVFDYIEAHKRGRTTEQIFARFDRKKSTIWSTLNTLKNEGLIHQPNGRGTAWLVTEDSTKASSISDLLIGLLSGESNANES